MRAANLPGFTMLVLALPNTIGLVHEQVSILNRDFCQGQAGWTAWSGATAHPWAISCAGGQNDSLPLRPPPLPQRRPHSVHLVDQITRPPHFAPQFPFHSEIDMPVINSAGFKSPTSKGQMMFYGLCHELGHLIAMWGNRRRQEDHHAWGISPPWHEKAPL